MLKQRTLKNTIQATGVGVHLGQKVLLTLKPAPINTGIIFRRMDCEPPVEIPAKADFVGDTSFCTTLIKDGVKVATIEHLLSALAGLGIDNLIVELDAPEVPIMDGSSASFVFLIQSVGIEEQNAPKKLLKILKPITVIDGDKKAQLTPYDGFKLDFDIDFDHPVIKNGGQKSEINFCTQTYINEISRARTFGFMKDFEWLRTNKLAKGASLDNAIVLDDYKVLNEGGLRFKDEFVRHKVLDAIGDLYLLGYGILGSFYGFKAGHMLNNKLVCQVLADQTSYEIIECDNHAPIEFAGADFCLPEALALQSA